MKVKTNKSLLKKSIRKTNELNTPPPYTEGHWEDEFDHWTSYQPVSNNGKWWITIQLEKLKNKIKGYQ
jgi:hypothetical protein